jgi:hypothetical protein
MKKTDLFKLALGCAYVLLASAWSSSFAQENKTGNSTGQNNKGEVGVYVAGNDAAKIAEERKLKMREEQTLKKEAIIKQMQIEAEQKEVAMKEADAQKKMEILQANDDAKKGQNVPEYVNGTKEHNALETEKPSNDNYTKSILAFEHDASAIIASASNYDDAKLALHLLIEKHMANFTATLSTKASNDLFYKSCQNEKLKLYEKFNNTKN